MQPGSINAVSIKNPIKRDQWLPLKKTDYGFLDVTRNFVGESSPDDNMQLSETHPVDMSRWFDVYIQYNIRI